MAIDTRERRASVVSLNPGAPSSVTPNSGKDQEWRQESGWGYAGLLVGAPVAGAWVYQRDQHPLPASLGFGVG